jgi:outer membrane receptor protein involved in Fe transport
LSLWGEAQIQWQERFRSTLGLRADGYRFTVTSDTAANSGRRHDAIVSPKLGLVFGPWAQTEYYLNAGYGFHSNDARGAVTTVNPDPRPGIRPVCVAPTIGACTGDPIRPVQPLVRARGYEIGVRTAWMPGMQSSLTLWRLDIASELVFVGDAGTTSPSRPSRRQGMEWANYWEAGGWLLLDGDLSLSQARYTDADPVGDRVPGSIEQAASVGASMRRGAWSGGMRLRYFGPRPLIEDNSVRSGSSTLVNVQFGYRITPQLQACLDILNLLDTRVSDIDYYYASQLPGEAAPVNDIHSHPAEPRALRLALRMSF